MLQKLLYFVAYMIYRPYLYQKEYLNREGLTHRFFPSVSVTIVLQCFMGMFFVGTVELGLLQKGDWLIPSGFHFVELSVLIFLFFFITGEKSASFLSFKRAYTVVLLIIAILICLLGLVTFVVSFESPIVIKR